MILVSANNIKDTTYIEVLVRGLTNSTHASRRTLLFYSAPREGERVVIIFIFL